jgi:type VI secretion system protein ImpF
MAKREIERTVQPSLLDRLTDLDPRGLGDGRVTYLESVRLFKASIQRDLEWLLNTRRIPSQPPDVLEELRHSMYLYGLPDLTSLSRDDPSARRQLLRRVEATIAQFEPRLTDVRITMVETEGEQRKRELRFVVEGTLVMDPTPEQVVFDTVLNFSSGEYEVAGASHA